MLQVISINRASLTQTGGEPDAASQGPVFSGADTLAFWSGATNIVAGDTNAKIDIFLKDLTNGDITRISTSGVNAQINGNSYTPSFSADGNIMVFHSDANDLVTGDSNNTSDVFVKNLTTNAVTRVSTGNGGVEGNGSATDAGISADGNLVVFRSHANNLVSGDTNNQRDIFLKNLTSGITMRLSTDASGNQANAGSDDPIISADGTKVAFWSLASNLVAGDTNTTYDVFVKDVATGAVTVVSSDAGGTIGNAGSFDPVFSPDGTKVAFRTASNNLFLNDTNGASDIFVKDLTTGILTLVSSAADGFTFGNADSFTPVFSPDGSKVAFASRASNLVSGDTNGMMDIFVKDLATGAISRVNTTPEGTQGFRDSFFPAFSPDGSRLAFYTQSANLVSGDANNAFDVYVVGLAGQQTINGSDGDETHTGGAANDTIDGGAGNDSLLGGAGDDSLLGGEGNDTIDGEGGQDVVDGGPGDDVLYGGEGVNWILGGDGNDSAMGGSGVDSIEGNAGNDTLEGNGGDDTLDGGADNDSLLGGAGGDSLLGGEGADYLNGGADSDFLDGGAGMDTLYGGDGSDTLLGEDGNDSLLGGEGNDWISAGDDNDYVMGSYGNDTIDGGNGDDSLGGGSHDDSMMGGAGNDSIAGHSGNDRMFGGAGNDGIWGDTGDDYAEGGAGDDTMTGDGGNDTLLGGEGNDWISARDDNDYVMGSYGNDTIDGGNGDDSLGGGSHDDSMMGGAGNDSIAGHSGNDRMFGGDGNDGIWGDTGNDYAEGGAGNDTMTGDGGNDTLHGGDGNDWIAARDDNDTLSGGTGADTLSGGSGSDVFVFYALSDSTAATRDVITDFVKGEDKLDLSAIAEISGLGDITLTYVSGYTFLTSGIFDLRMTGDFTQGINQLTADEFIF